METPGQVMEASEDGMDYSTGPSSLPGVNADGGKVEGGGEPEVALYPPQGPAAGGMNEQGLPQAEVNDVGGVSDRWERTFEGKKPRTLDISVLSPDIVVLFQRVKSFQFLFQIP